MEREDVLLLLIPLLVGATALAAGCVPRRPPRVSSAREAERLLWRAIWAPLLPALVVLAVVVGWALHEPDASERLPFAIRLAAAPLLVLWGRALLRAARAIFPGPVTLGTVGLLRPRVVVDPALRAALDPALLHAALAHERAHVRHRDPLRVLGAQLVTDLLGPLPAARQRLLAWREALECSRDDEAREHGADGADLAAAIVQVAHGSSGPPGRAVACLTDAERALRSRVMRLLEPLPPAAAATPPALEPSTLLLLTLASLALAAGFLFGEQAMQLVLSSLS